MTKSPQTLSEADRRILAEWAANCAQRVLCLFEIEKPGDDRPRAAIARAQAFARAELDTKSAIQQRFGGGSAAREAKLAASAAAARSAGQASAVCHMAAHALGAAGYAASAVGLANAGRPDAVNEEIRWQLAHATKDVLAALRSLPPVGEDRSGPLGPGLLASGQVGEIIRQLQAGL